MLSQSNKERKKRGMREKKKSSVDFNHAIKIIDFSLLPTK